MELVAVDHVQLAMPPGGEDEARRFYGGVLGLPEIPKPPELAGRGGCWFGSTGVQVHVGVEADFRPARKAHPAFRVRRVAVLAVRARAAGYRVVDDVPIRGFSRVFVDDPFGNRIELMEPR